MSKATEKYLSRHAEPECKGVRHNLLADALTKNFKNVLVIPAYGETVSLFQLIENIFSSSKETLVILIVNARADSPSWVHEENRKIIRFLKENLPPSLLLIDRASPNHFLPAHEGVGLARKIGCDIALTLHQEKKVISPWIHCTDADVSLPSDYFERSEKVTDEKISALLYPFQHECHEDASLTEATLLYECYLRYYVLGLQEAGSPYAYHSLGSTLAIRASAYGAVGGFPKKMAGEDFYLLNKLAKVGKILCLAGEPLLIEGRISKRTPFGTGMALTKILESQKNEKPFLIYNPKIFDYLKLWLQTLKQAAGPSQTELRHLHTWFDALQTLKLVHRLRDKNFPSLPLKEAFAQADFLKLPSLALLEDLPGLRNFLIKKEITTYTNHDHD